jgi:ABC-type multidrug transport system ATPase subunit
MQMRLTFARSLINDPELLFLDEPTSGLDPVNARNVKNIILDRRARGCTIFLTTHDMSTADELCDRVAVVVDDRIVALDTPAELKIARSQRRVRVEYRGDNGQLGTADFPMDGLADDLMSSLASSITCLSPGRCSAASSRRTLEHAFDLFGNDHRPRLGRHGGCPARRPRAR